ncbi:TlpA family protein disulfide reductase [Bradyrhizobium sp. INPA01-394B]|uniref:TlpA family protein disulfide reductase n=1 Tax=Bradyrhizobium campsiandrae TaxID=1729892 RepID=A0ABR7U328_9BRAD|nr:TlpA disulfide reductase family protein [Bradyrhizobium campsiandrae]MBC9882612.1 TlpA family protein disulfide reductase [Bradyrhizobium campsiandrae]MBC9977985.1 TlpA family protein disulfide reductase [Bradyrhizobium campsiandrae]
MRDEACEGPVLSRRSILMAAAASLAVPRAGRAQDRWPPVFEAGRSQFTVVRPRASMPQLRLQDVRGRDAIVTAKPSRITLVNFWATWCAACKLDLPMLASLAGSRPDRLDIVAICTDTKDLRKIRAFLSGLAVQNLACYVDTYGAAAEASTTMFSLVGMPITYLVGTSSRIEGYIAGAPDWLSPAGARLLQFYREQD